MTFQPIGANRAALFCTDADLSAYGFTAGTLTLDQALRLLRDACRPAGLPLEPVEELELYPDDRGVLIFARRKPARPRPPHGLRPGRVRRYPT